MQGHELKEQNSLTLSEQSERIYATAGRLPHSGSAAYLHRGSVLSKCPLRTYRF